MLTTNLSFTQEQGKATWLRHVLIPGYNDCEDSLARLAMIRERYPCVQRVELLPFRKLCLEKYRQLEIVFPLEDTPEMSTERTEAYFRQFFS